MISRFASTLNYTSVNEDWLAEAAGLRLVDGDRVLCITGSGDRVLDLLAVADCEVVGIDLNPAQNALLHVKIAAMRQLRFADYARFLGLEAAPARWRLDRLAELELPGWVTDWFRPRKRLIARGVLYQGRWERHYRRISRFGRAVRARDLRTLFAFDDVEAQAAWVRKNWDTSTWRAAWWLSTTPLSARVLFGDPAFYSNLDVDPTRYLYQSFRRGLQHHLARDSFMASLVFTGRLLPSARPPYLTPEGVARIRPRLDRIEVVTADLLDHLDVHRGYTALSLSDVPSFCDRGQFDRLLHGTVRAARPGARVLIRQFMTRHPIPTVPGLVRDAALEEHLARIDRAFCCTFIAAEVSARGTE